jgi:type IV pilus assembly protein PilW
MKTSKSPARSDFEHAKILVAAFSVAAKAKRQNGFTLVELLVGIAMSLLTIIAIYQILTVWDGRRRTITSGSGALIANSIGGFELERSLQTAGVGFGNVLPATIGCTVQAKNTGFPTTDYSFSFVPIQIDQGASGAPDTIRVLGGNSAYSNSVQQLISSTATSKTLQSRVGYNAGDIIIVAGNNTPSRDCALMEVTGNSSVANTIDHGIIPYTSYYSGTTTTPIMNPAPGTATFSTGEVYNLGPQPQRTEWKVNTATAVLTRTNTLRDTVVFEVADGVINLQAQYGIDGSDGTAPDGLISASEWQDATPTANWHRVLAVRVALLSRSTQLEQEIVTPSAPTWATSTTFAMTNLDGTTAITTGVNDWRRYRYKVYETVVSLRNMLWGAKL